MQVLDVGLDAFELRCQRPDLGAQPGDFLPQGLCVGIPGRRILRHGYHFVALALMGSQDPLGLELLGGPQGG